jgi:hypothetical protein
MKIFISMPMKAKSTEQVRVEMNKVFEKIKEKLPEAELIDSIIDGADKEIAIKGDDIGIWYLGESIKRLAQADIAFFVNDWKEKRGCRIEREIAEAYGKICTEIIVNY